jgi:hypothetical protein
VKCRGVFSLLTCLCESRFISVPCSSSAAAAAEIDAMLQLTSPEGLEGLSVSQLETKLRRVQRRVTASVASPRSPRSPRLSLSPAAAASGGGATSPRTRRRTMQSGISPRHMPVIGGELEHGFGGKVPAPVLMSTPIGGRRGVSMVSQLPGGDGGGGEAGRGKSGASFGGQ